MEKLRICSELILDPELKEDFSEYIRDGIFFMKNAGFDAVDFTFNMMESVKGDWTGYIEKAMSDADEAGIRFEVCHLPHSSKLAKNPDTVPAFNERMHKAIDAAALLGVDFAVLHPNTTTLTMDIYDRKAQYDSVMNHLALFAEHAEKVGLNIVVENMRYVPSHIPSHRYCQEPDELCEIADALGIGVCWDFGHANIDGLKQSEALSYVGNRLKVLHVNDNNGVDDIHISPFTGTVDWKDAMHGLALCGFDGLFNYELKTARVPRTLQGKFAEYMIRAANELISYMR